MKWIDLHCDTLSILTGGADTGIERCRAGLRENNLCVDALVMLMPLTSAMAKSVGTEKYGIGRTGKYCQ